jgi:hypothetical protein
VVENGSHGEIPLSVEKDSLTYQFLYEHGALKGVGTSLLRQGEIKFGAPTEKMRASIKEEEDLSRLIRMCVCLLTATSWDEVLDTP